MAVPAQPHGSELSTRVGELRRLTFMYCDVVGSTELSGRQDLETYHELMRGYRDACRDVIESRFEGHIVHIKGDGALSTFGFPVAHENDAERAVRAGLALVQAVHELSEVSERVAGEPLDVRVGVHHGPVYLDLDEADIYGLAANVGARLQGLADPGKVVISEEVRRLVEDRFEIDACEPQLVKGVDEPLAHYRVRGLREATGNRSWSSPLVERDEQLALLRAAWAPAAEASASGATGVLIRADAGLGKSRLACALIDEVGAAGHRIMQLRGSPFHGDVGLHPIRDLVDARCEIGDDSPADERLRRLTADVGGLGLDTGDVVPLLAPVLGIEPRAGYEPAATEGRKLEEQVAQAVLDYLRACIGERPTLMVAEDLHWFDDATRDVLAELVRTGPATLLVVGTSRNSERLEWETIELRPLSSAGRLALIDALREGLTDEDRLALAARSDGVPLYLEELVRAGSEASVPAGVDVPVPGSVPAALYEPLVARLYQTPDALPVAATAAAAGHSVDRALLAATMPMPAEDLDSALTALVERQVVEQIDPGGTRYRFRHELLREVAYELQPPSWRRKVHDRLCDLLLTNERRRLARARVALRAGGAVPRSGGGLREGGGLGAAPRRVSTRREAHLTRAIDVAMPKVDDPDRDHLEVALRLQRGFLAMSAEGAASADASADFERCLAAGLERPRRRRHVQAR